MLTSFAELQGKVRLSQVNLGQVKLIENGCLQALGQDMLDKIKEVRFKWKVSLVEDGQLLALQAYQVRLDLVWLGQVRSGQVRLGQVKIGEVRGGEYRCLQAFQT